MKLNAHRTVRFPLKVKLLTLMIILIASSLVIFVAIALKIFKDDKSAYIYETLLNKASSGRIIFGQKLRSIGPGPLAIKGDKIFYGAEDVTETFAGLASEESAFKLGFAIPVQNEFYGLIDGRIGPLSQEKTVLDMIFKNSVSQGVKEAKLAGKKQLYAFDYDPELNFIYTVALPTELAFAATTDLINRSVLYGLFILGAALVLSVLLARPLTAQLELLFGMTQDIAQGNFDKRVNIKSHDEVGALSDSVNDMADKIVLYMNEMKEKARLENEVAVAQLVQSSFFPAPSLNLKDIKFYAHIEPASECGGDWWSVYTHEDWSVFFIADATGHGVPAALLTATINCCKSSLSFMLESRPDLLSKPDEILRYMNHAVCEAGKEIQVTCFVGCYGHKTQDFIYSNASHTPPLLFAPTEGELSKDHFLPLIEANGPRLGQAKNSSFVAEKKSLKKNDTIFFYTDGIIEAEDSEGNRWGERRMLKSLVQHGINQPRDIIEGVFADLNAFTTGKPKSDDLTAVTMKVIS